MRQEMIAGVLMTVIGAAILVFPDKVWKIAESWKQRNSEGPSDGYRKVCRIVGTVCAAAGILLMSGVIS